LSSNSVKTDCKIARVNASLIFKVTDESSSRSMREVTKTEGLLTFHVYPETFWEPLEVATNSSLLVEESTSIAITQYDLRVAVRAEMSPKDIIYMVTMA
jgi:hypothetical protein